MRLDDALGCQLRVVLLEGQSCGIKSPNDIGELKELIYHGEAPVHLDVEGFIATVCQGDSCVQSHRSVSRPMLRAHKGDDSPLPRRRGFIFFVWNVHEINIQGGVDRAGDVSWHGHGQVLQLLRLGFQCGLNGILFRCDSPKLLFQGGPKGLLLGNFPLQIFPFRKPLPSLFFVPVRRLGSLEGDKLGLIALQSLISFFTRLLQLGIQVFNQKAGVIQLFFQAFFRCHLFSQVFRQGPDGLVLPVDVRLQSSGGSVHLRIHHLFDFHLSLPPGLFQHGAPHGLNVHGRGVDLNGGNYCRSLDWGCRSRHWGLLNTSEFVNQAAEQPLFLLNWRSGWGGWWRRVGKQFVHDLLLEILRHMGEIPGMGDIVRHFRQRGPVAHDNIIDAQTCQVSQEFVGYRPGVAKEHDAGVRELDTKFLHQLKNVGASFQLLPEEKNVGW